MLLNDDIMNIPLPFDDFEIVSFSKPSSKTFDSSSFSNQDDDIILPITIPASIENKPFPQKLYHILSDTRFIGIIEWLPDGKAFQLVDPLRFTEDVSTIYFKRE